MTGSRIGPYEILAKVGEGGMGEVYRARDTKLAREVAIKVLPPTFAADADRIARFRREAHVLASLNHPNIAAIYGFEDTTSQLGLVLEFVEGPTLAHRIASGPLPVDEACRIARQIADALEAAHAHGVIHRDLKPANIKLTADDKVKVLDFGLAKALDDGPSGRSGEVSQSPTITSPAMTRAGMILGTAAYMAPEQARGKGVDKRADIWAFGCVLFEMITGRRAFAGDEVSDTLAMVLMKEVDWSALPATTPAVLRRLLQRCLEKDRSRRLADIADARLDLDEALSPGANELAAPAAHAPRRAAWTAYLPWAIAAVAVLALGVVIARSGAVARVASSGVPARLNTDLGGELTVVSLAISRDGSTVAAAAMPTLNRAAPSQLYIRRLNELVARPLSGTTGAALPFFSPDGQWVAFFGGNKLRKVSVNGGPVITLADGIFSGGGTWLESGNLVFAPGGADNVAPLMQVPTGGGTPQPLNAGVKTHARISRIEALPGDRGILYAESAPSGVFNDGQVMVQPLPAGEPKVVYRGGYAPQYLASGHLTFIHDEALLAVPFDLNRLEAIGTAVPLIDRVSANSALGMSTLAASNNGTILYAPSESLGAASTAAVSWLDRNGRFSVLRAAPSFWGTPRFSPNGRLLALAIVEGDNPDIWTYDWERDTLSRLTFDPSADIMPVWTPDGRRIAFGSRRDGALNLYWQRADGGGEAQRLTTSTMGQLPGSFHPNGKLLAFHQGSPGDNKQDIMVLPIEGDETSGWKPGTPIEVVGGPFSKSQPRFSPDGKWLAYSSNETGRYEVYVRPYPNSGGKWQISSNGATEPHWSTVRPELFFTQNAGNDQRIMVASYSTDGDSFRADKARLWTEQRVSGNTPFGTYGAYTALHPDGQRFALLQPGGAAETRQRTPLIVIFNAFELLRK